MRKLLFVISQLYKGGAETSLVNLLNCIDYTVYDIDLVILNQSPATDAVSLIPYVNKNVHLCDAYAEYHKFSFLRRFNAKFMYTTEQKVAFYYPALDFVHNKMYDWAFYVGEWCSPAFVAYHTHAAHKVAWIHCDLSKSSNFDKELYFHFYEYFERYIFVSKNALEASVKEYPFLKEKATIIYNVNDVKYIKSQANEAIEDYKFNELIPTILTCANIRPEKNHIRQIEVMAELKKRGVIFNWINIGSTSDTKYVERIKNLIKEENIEDRFILLGSKKNPYKYIKSADAVAVLSDYESWSMVITESKVLGIPVVATKTAGALEQIIHNETGVLCDFSVKSIADEIERYLSDPNLKKRIKKNLEHFDNTNDIMKSFDDLTENRQVENNRENNILFVIDDINYKGGAHSATLLQIKELVKLGKKVTIFSNTMPDCQKRIELEGVSFLSWRNVTLFFLLGKRLMACLRNKFINKSDKKQRIGIWFKVKLRKDGKAHENILNLKLSELFSKYKIVCVMSEASAFRKNVAESTANQKIQWIHTDYDEWRNFNDWTRNITKDDEVIYKKFDTIVLLSEIIRSKFIKSFPKLESKAIVLKNYLPVNEIIKKGSINQCCPKVHFLTIGRLSEEKGFKRLLKILKQIYDEGYQFYWEIVGDGPLKDVLIELVNQYGLEDMVKVLGHKENPYRYLVKTQVFALLSLYEGMPNTIYEALILGKPVLATNVGGTSDQLERGKYGWLVENDEKAIYEGIKHILDNQNEIEFYAQNLKQYSYDCEEITKEIKQVFS